MRDTQLAIGAVLFTLIAQGCTTPGSTASSQEAEKKSALDRFIEVTGITLRSEVDPKKNGFQDPAIFQVVDPSGDGNTFSRVRAGLTAQWEFGSWDIGPLLDYQKNTQVGEEQDALGVGAIATHWYGDIFEDSAVALTNVTARYKRDDIAESHGWLAKLSVSPMTKSFFLRPTKEHHSGVERMFVLEPDVGILFERADDPFMTGASGQVGRGFASVKGTFFLFRDMFYDGWELNGEARYWHDIYHEDAYSGTARDRHYYRLGSTFYLDQKHRFGLSVDYIRGENPETNLPDQEIVQFTMRVKF